MMATHWIVDIMSVMSLMPTEEFGGTVMMKISLKLVIYQKGFILERATKKSDVRLKRFIICGLYQNKPSDKIQLYFFQEFSNISKIHHMKNVIEDLNVLRKYFSVR